MEEIDFSKSEDRPAAPQKYFINGAEAKHYAGGRDAYIKYVGSTAMAGAVSLVFLFVELTLLAGSVTGRFDAPAFVHPILLLFVLLFGVAFIAGLALSIVTIGMVTSVFSQLAANSFAIDEAAEDTVFGVCCETIIPHWSS